MSLDPKKTAFDTLLLALEQSHHDQVVAIAQEILSLYPGDVETRYCLGISQLLLGHNGAGLETLNSLMSDHYRDTLLHADLDTKQWFGHCALQLAILAEFQPPSPDEKVLPYVRTWSRFAELVGRSVGDESLIQGGLALQKRVWHFETGGEVGERQVFRPDSPPLLQVEPTNQCNLGCTMCTRNDMKRKLGFMDPALWQTLLDTWAGKKNERYLPHLAHPQRRPFGVVVRGHIKFFFLGEPLLHKDLAAMIHAARQQGCSVSVQTNGTLLSNPAIRARLLDAAPSDIGISIDRLDARSYEAVRKGSTWENLLAGVQALHEERRQRGLEETVGIYTTTIIPENSPKNLARADQFLEPLRPFVDQTHEISLNLTQSPQFIDDNGVMKTYPREENDQYSQETFMCNEPFNGLNVLWDGTVTPCCIDVDGEVPLGNVATDGGIEVIWQSDRVRKFQQAHLEKKLADYPFCARCMNAPLE